jgi:hypothetical protein
MQPLRVGVVGYGIDQSCTSPLSPLWTNTNWFPFLNHNDLSKEKYPNAAIVRSIDEMVADPSIDLVVVPRPNTHFPLLKRRCGRATRGARKTFYDKFRRWKSIGSTREWFKGKLSVFKTGAM